MFLTKAKPLPSGLAKALLAAWQHVLQALVRKLSQMSDKSFGQRNSEKLSGLANSASSCQSGAG